MTRIDGGKRGLIMGLANDRSLAWGIAKALAEQGAELAFSYQGEAMEKRVRPLAEQLGSDFLIDCDVADMEALDRPSTQLQGALGDDRLRRPRDRLFRQERAARASSSTPAIDNFLMTMNISVYSFVAVAQRARAMMADGGALLTLTYYGAEKVIPHYNVMGVAKAALETSVKYLAMDLGPGRHPRQRDLGRADQDAGGERHRRLPLHHEVERI